MTGHWNGKQSILLQYRQLFLLLRGENNAAVGVFILFQTFIHPLCHCVVDLCLTHSGNLELFGKYYFTFYFRNSSCKVPGVIFFLFFAESAFIAIGNARNIVRNRIVNLFIIIMWLFGNLKTFAPTGDADKTASCIFCKTTKRISSFIIFTEVHGHKYSSFYLFDELFAPFI